MPQSKSANVWEVEDPDLARQRAEERAYGVEDTEELEYAERVQREGRAEAAYRPTTRELAGLRKDLAPESARTFTAFSQTVYADGALSRKTKTLIAVAVAHVTQCPYCIRGCTDAALDSGATAREIMEAIWVATEMRAGAAYEHSILALEEIEQRQRQRQQHS